MMEQEQQDKLTKLSNMFFLIGTGIYLPILFTWIFNRIPGCSGHMNYEELTHDIMIACYIMSATLSFVENNFIKK